MPITFGTNIAALQAKLRLDRANSGLSKSFERLSSGLRINSASDDAAGLAVASALNNQSKLYTQSVRNINDGVSYLSSIEAGANSLQGILARMQELAEQSANGVYTSTQRSALDAEFQALDSEYNRIVDTTTFNGRAVLTESELHQGITIQAGSSSTETLQFTFDPPATTITAGTGTYQTPTSVDPGLGGAVGQGGFVTGDFDNDGTQDFIESFGPGVQVVLGNGNGSFKAGISSTFLTGGTTGPFSAADFNGDGKLDLVANHGSFMEIVLGNGNGTFAATTTFYATATGANMAPVTGDFNGDGKLDIASDTGIAFHIYLGNGDGSFTAPVTYAAVTNGGIETADINGDGKLDIVTVGKFGANATRAQVSLGNGNGTFSTSISYLVAPHPYQGAGLAVVDFDHDGNLDILTSSSFNFDSYYNVLLGNGNGSYKASTSGYIAGTGLVVTDITTTDFNSDGKTDFVVGVFDSISTSESHLYTFLGNGNGTFQVRASYDATPADSAYIFGIGLADFTGDGVSDLLTAHNGPDGFLFGGVSAPTSVPGSLLPETDLSIATQAGAQSALSSLETSQAQVSALLGAVGAFTSRLSFAQTLSATRAENFAAAADRITSVDVAEEVANLVGKQILANAAAAILAQANQQPNVLLSLLKNT